MSWQGFGQQVSLPLMAVLLALGLTACASTTDTRTDEEGVACAAPSLFVPQASGPTVVDTAEGKADLRRLDALEQVGCELTDVLAQLEAPSANDQSRRQLAIADALLASGRTELAVTWFERSDSFEGYQRLLELHGADGPLADDAAYLRYEVNRAQLQQAFGEEVLWPVVSQAQPLFVSGGRTALYAETDIDGPVLEGLDVDERVYLLDVVVLEDGESYWVQAYYPATLALGWIPAETLAQYPEHVRNSLARLDNFEGRSYAQQLLFTGLLHGMDVDQLTPLSGADYFAGAQLQQSNTMALLQRLGQVTEACVAEAEQLEQSFAHSLMDEGPAPQPAQAPYSEDMRTALAALTAARGETAEASAMAALRNELSTSAYQYFRIRVQGQVDQRLCNSLPNAAGNPELATQSCVAVRELERCVNRVDAIFQQ